MGEIKHWYALYTRPRMEKKVHLLLSERGYVSYCPLNKVRKQWSDRVKVVEEPLFKSYVFVQLDAQQKTDVRFVNGVVNFVYWLGKPAMIREDEIVRIRKFMKEYEDVLLEPLDLQVDSPVVVTSGVLMDKQGRVLRTRNQLVEIEIESLGCKLVAVLPKKHLARIPSTLTHK
jgi:transcription antitermination factor NusG